MFTFEFVAFIGLKSVFIIFGGAFCLLIVFPCAYLFESKDLSNRQRSNTEEA